MEAAGSLSDPEGLWPRPTLHSAPTGPLALVRTGAHCGAEYMESAVRAHSGLNYNQAAPTKQRSQRASASSAERSAVPAAHGRSRHSTTAFPAVRLSSESEVLSNLRGRCGWVAKIPSSFHRYAICWATRLPVSPSP